MKQIKFIFLIAALLVSSSTFAKGKYGEDSVECIKYLSYYQEYYKQKAYDEATPSWRNAYKYCPPTASQNMLLNGQYLVRRLISKNTRNQDYRKALVDTLMRLHDLRIEYYPKYAVQAYNSKGQDVFNYIKNDNSRQYDEYSSIIAHNAEGTKPTLFVHQFNAAVSLYRDGKMTSEQIINLYQSSISLLEKGDKSTEAAASEIAAAKSELESRFVSSRVADCETMVKYFTPKFDAAPEDPELATTIVRVLSTAEDCTDQQLFVKALAIVYKERPSFNSAYLLFRLNAKTGNKDDAVKYLEEAISFEESDKQKDSEFYMELAQYCFSNGDKSKAYESAKMAASLDPAKSGKAYYLIGNIWGASNCGSGVEGAGHYWVAVDYMIKAKEADSSLAEEANICIGRYAARFPEVGEAFMYGYEEGMVKTVSCAGMTATTTVRLKK